jgi:leucyl/phenylalanyl-tRNA--protein transferase
MPIFVLSQALEFPDPRLALPSGVLAVGGDFSPERLLVGYQRGIFPWPMPGASLLWFSPDPRFVLDPRRAHVGRSLKKTMRSGAFEVRADTAFDEVLRGCAKTRRPGQRGTWLVEPLVRGLRGLHERGYAHSIEAFSEGELVGGLYGVSLGGAFFGESMFARVPDASKVAFATLLAQLVSWGFDFVDCQVHTEHLERFGAVDVPREAFLEALAASLERPTRAGPWTLELDPRAASQALSG